MNSAENKIDLILHKVKGIANFIHVSNLIQSSV